MSVLQVITSLALETLMDYQKNREALVSSDKGCISFAQDKGQRNSFRYSNRPAAHVALPQPGRLDFGPYKIKKR